MSWFLNRLRTMSFPEILFRGKQAARKQYEKRFVVKNPPVLNSCTINELPFEQINISETDFSGSISIFGKNFNYLTDDINWHKDLFSEEEFTLVFSKSMNIRKHENLSAKVVWEINRMQFLTILAIQYQTNKKEEYLEHFQRIIDSWITANPYLQGINWYSNIEVNLRLITWYFCWNILRINELISENNQLKKFVEERWLPSIYLHCKYSFENPSKYSSSNNHLISEYAGLFIANTLWQFPEHDEWLPYAKNGLEKEITRQHSGNGINKEEAAEYIQFITDFFLLSFIVGKRSNISFSHEYETQLMRIIEYINNLLDIKGNFPKYGDEDDGKCIFFTEDAHFNNFESILTTGALLFNDPRFKSEKREMDIKNKILFGDAGITLYNQLEATTINKRSAFYEKEGHFIFRHTAG